MFKVLGGGLTEGKGESHQAPIFGDLSSTYSTHSALKKAS